MGNALRTPFGGERNGLVNLCIFSGKAVAAIFVQG